jgi:hemoglobin
MISDLETRSDIDRLLIEFYKVVMHDAEIGHHFDELDLDHHLPIIGDFWEKVLFGNPVYFNNPLTVHQKLHERFPLRPEHFLRWVEVFSHTVDALFAGEMADLAKFRAHTIGRNLDQRLNGGVQIAR